MSIQLTVAYDGLPTAGTGDFAWQRRLLVSGVAAFPIEAALHVARQHIEQTVPELTRLMVAFAGASLSVFKGGEGVCLYMVNAHWSARGLKSVL